MLDVLELTLIEEYLAIADCSEITVQSCLESLQCKN